MCRPWSSCCCCRCCCRSASANRPASTRSWCSSSSPRCVIFIVVAAPHVNPANWHPFIPPQIDRCRGPVAFRLGRHPDRRLADLLRLHRLRCGFDRGGGNDQPAAQPADRHHRFAGDLHDPLHRRLRHPDRRRALRPHRHQGADRRCAQAARHRLGRGADLDRRTGRHHDRHAGAVFRPDPRRAGDVA